MPKRKPREKDGVQEPLREALHAAGWITGKTHGNRYMKGWPDLMCFHRERGFIWIECKRPSGGSLTPAQVNTFGEWTDAGIDIWVLNDPSYEGFLATIAGPANWQTWL